MKHRINKPPGPHPYDRAREELKSSGGGLFGVTLNSPMNGDTGGGLRAWMGDELTAFEISGVRGMHARYYCVKYRDAYMRSPWFVNLQAPQDADELARLATVFMDLINTQRTN